MCEETKGPVIFCMLKLYIGPLSNPVPWVVQTIFLPTTA